MAEKVIVIGGPTAGGKTALSLELAERLGGEIVSADSMQIYKGMDIGTAKATPEERGRVPHHMLDVAEPWEDYSVARYVEEASRCCDDIISRGKIPIITGGTGLYIDSLLAGRDFAGRQQGDDSLRSSLLSQYDEAGGEEMLRRLSEFDPERAEKLKPGDRRRIVRAIEIYTLTGITATEHDRRTRALPKAYEGPYFVLSFKDRAMLYRRIDRRVELMEQAGLWDEAEGLVSSGLPDNCTAMQAIGYKEAVRALRGEISRPEAIELIKMNSRRYAKRQLTWFRRREDACWLLWDEEPDIQKGIDEALDYISSFGK